MAIEFNTRSWKQCVCVDISLDSNNLFEVEGYINGNVLAKEKSKDEKFALIFQYSWIYELRARCVLGERWMHVYEVWEEI